MQRGVLFMHEGSSEPQLLLQPLKETKKKKTVCSVPRRIAARGTMAILAATHGSVHERNSLDLSHSAEDAKDLLRRLEAMSSFSYTGKIMLAFNRLGLLPH